MNYANDPAAYAYDHLKIKLLPHQENIISSIMNNKRVLCLSGHGIGKSLTAAVAINWWIDIIGGVSISTAPTQAQLKRVLWREIRKLRLGRNMPPKSTSIWKNSNNWAAGYTATSSHAFQGVHSDRVLIVFDECVGIDAELWEAAESMMLGQCRWLAIGNPLSTSSYAYGVSTLPSWHVMNISSIEVAENYDIPGMASSQWVDDMHRQYSNIVDYPTKCSWRGEYWKPTPTLLSRVYGEWPNNNEEAVCTISWTDNVEYEKDIYIGVDPALGGDRTAIAVRSGKSIISLQVSYSKDISQIVDMVISLENKYSDAGYNVYVSYDATGLGAGIKMPGTYHWVAHHGAAKAINSKKYTNRRAEIFDSIGNVSLRKQDPLMLEASTELMLHTLEISVDGRRSLIKKDTVKKLLGRSPDLADAIALTFASEGRRVEIYEMAMV